MGFLSSHTQRNSPSSTTVHYAVNVIYSQLARFALSIVPSFPTFAASKKYFSFFPFPLLPSSVDTADAQGEHRHAHTRCHTLDSLSHIQVNIIGLPWHSFSLPFSFFFSRFHPENRRRPIHAISMMRNLVFKPFAVFTVGH